MTEIWSLESQTPIVAVGAVVRFFTRHLTFHARAEEPKISITSLLKWLSSGIPFRGQGQIKGALFFSEKVQFQLYSDTLKWRFPEMEVAGSPVHPFFFGIFHETIQLFFGTPMTMALWTPNHGEDLSTPSFSLRLYGELESSHPGRLTLWLGCRRWRQVVQWERIPVEYYGEIWPSQTVTIQYIYIFKKITLWWLLPREKWWYIMESQRSICHMPYPSFRLHTEQRKSYDKNHSWVFANISTPIIALRPLLKYDMHREIRKDIDCSRLRVYASWFLNG